MICKEQDCGVVEANMTAGFTLHDDGSWELSYMGDDNGRIACTEGHDNFTPELDRSLSAYVETILPGSTWEGSAP
jgi:hypothetical protein